jgi:hypothetical protein
LAAGLARPADVVVNPFAGIWSTFGGAGGLTLQVVTPAKGVPAVAFYSDGKASCPSQTVYYTGAYSGSDSGQVAGCTSNGGRHLMAWYKSGAGPQHGTFSVDVAAGDTSFSGTYKELSDGTTGAYDGTFVRDTPGSGRTQPSTTPTTTTTATGGGPTKSPTIESIMAPPNNEAGGVEFLLPGSDPWDWEPLQAGTQFPVGTVIHTGFKTSAVVVLPGVGRVTLEPMTTVRIVKWPNGTLGVLLKWGGTLNDIPTAHNRKTATDFEIIPATCVAGVRGTRFSAEYVPAEKTATIRAIVDSVLVTPINRSLKRLVLRAGHQVTVTPTKVGRVTGFKNEQPTEAPPATDLTGNWQPSDPASPAWKLTSGANRTTLTALWRGGPGHTGLVGGFSGALSSQRTQYDGNLRITEGSLDIGGTMTFKIVSANSLSVTYKQSNGVGGTFTLNRIGG